jgi:TatD DNase family protein
MKTHDTHAHLDYLLKLDPSFDIKKHLVSCDFWIQPGVNVERDRYCLDNFMSKPLEFPNMYFMIGAHPGEVNESWNKKSLDNFLAKQQKIIEDFSKEIRNLENPNGKIVAIGEIGLDYREGMPQEVKDYQIELFEHQLLLAKKLNLPFVIHCRDAFEDLIKTIQKTLGNGKLEKPFLIHCFTSGLENYSKITEMGGYVAFGGITTYKNTDKLQEVVLQSKHNGNFVFETDLPWLAPGKYRGKTNYPEYIKLVVDHIAKVQNENTENILRKSFENSEKIFGKLI